MKKLCTAFALILLMTQAAAAASSEAPTPRPSPRTPVNRQSLAERKPIVAPSSTVQGEATVIDSEKLHIGDIDIRLFGIVPPQLSANFGPQARSTLDKLVTGQPISCLIRDRDQAGRFLATCHTASNTDLAVELLRRGLAVTARGSLASTELMQPYMSAEQAAQSQKVGLWSGVTPPLAVVATPVIAATPVVVSQPATQNQAVVMPPPAPPATAVADIKKDAPAPKADVVDSKVPAAPMTASSLLPPSDDTYAVPETSSNFFARYQILITGLIMLVTALTILGVVSRQRRQEKRDEMKAIAAALRGELTAARGVCVARIKAIQGEVEDKAATWPRIRATLYQAYIGRLGWLGADLARQIASIYGQSSDYAAYYNTDDDAKVETTPKRQALQTLVHHIEEVLPRLTQIEQTGRKAAFTGPAFAKAPTLVERSITVPSTSEKAEATEVTHAPLASHPIWETMRKFTRDRFEDKHGSTSHEQDYDALIEEEMANLTFGEAEDEHDLAPNVTKIRPTGS